MWIPEPVKKFFNNILKSILKPLEEWIKALPLVKRIFAVLFTVLIALGVYYHQKVWDFVQSSGIYYRAATISKTSSFFNADHSQRLKSLINNIEKDLVDSEYPKKNASPDDYNPWTISQIVVSCKSSKTIPIVNDYCSYINSSRSHINSCSCWSEFGNIGYPNYVATSWVMMGMAQYKNKLPDRLVDYIIQNQNIAGWWSVFPSSRAEDASTLVTAWLIFSLHKNLDVGNISNNKIAEVNHAITNGLTWLKGQFDHSADSWFDYPQSNEKKESVSINGLILFVINQVESDSNIKETFNKEWLKRFDDYLKVVQIKINSSFNINSGYTSGHSIELSNGGFTKDNNNNYDLPWLIVGCVTAFPNASIGTKTKILNFFNGVVDQGESLFSSSMSPRPQPWLASEYLFSLRILNRENFY